MIAKGTWALGAGEASSAEVGERPALCLQMMSPRSLPIHSCLSCELLQIGGMSGLSCCHGMGGAAEKIEQDSVAYDCQSPVALS